MFFAENTSKNKTTCLPIVSIWLLIFFISELITNYRLWFSQNNLNKSVPLHIDWIIFFFAIWLLFCYKIICSGQEVLKLKFEL